MVHKKWFNCYSILSSVIITNLPALFQEVSLNDPNWTKLTAPWTHISQDLLVFRICNYVLSVTVVILHGPLDHRSWRHYNRSKHCELLIHRHSIIAQMIWILRKNTVITSNFIQLSGLLLYELWQLYRTTLRILMSL